jgi:hypothetical protein
VSPALKALGEQPTRLRFGLPRWLQVFNTTVALFQIVTVIRHFSPFGVGASAVLVVLVLLAWFGLDTKVDDGGVTAIGGWGRRRILWTEVSQFASDPRTFRPVLVLTNGRTKRLAYVPDEAFADLHRRWRQAVDSTPIGRIRH